MALGCDESAGSGRLRAIEAATIDLLAHTRPVDEHVLLPVGGPLARSAGMLLHFPHSRTIPALGLTRFTGSSGWEQRLCRA